MSAGVPSNGNGLPSSSSRTSSRKPLSSPLAVKNILMESNQPSPVRATASACQARSLARASASGSARLWSVKRRWTASRMPSADSPMACRNPKANRWVTRCMSSALAERVVL